jgi:uncharacterized protein YpmB
MEKGQVVTVYQDPITEVYPEGKAKLIRRLEDCGLARDKGVEFWEVAFLEDEGEETYNRFIKVK